MRLYLIFLLSRWLRMANATLGSLIIDIEGAVLSPEERELLAYPLVGGLVLFARNYESRAQLRALCASIRAIRAQPLLILVDQEGGRVQRFQAEFTKLPALYKIGQLFNDDPVKALHLAHLVGWVMAAELLAAGLDLSLAPILDLYHPESKAIANRAFHTDPQVVIVLTRELIKGMNRAGMAACGKHFPGHGDILLDSHVAMPTDPRSLETLLNRDLKPFIALIQEDIPGIMAAHIIYEAVDSKPIGFSSVWLKDILRKQLGFKGLIFSDDLNMEGANVSDNYADRFQIARAAGCDFILLCNNRPGVIQILDNVRIKDHQVQNQWQILRGKPHPSYNAADPIWQALNQAQKKLAEFSERSQH